MRWALSEGLLFLRAGILFMETEWRAGSLGKFRADSLLVVLLRGLAGLAARL